MQLLDELFEEPQLFHHPEKPKGAWVEIPIEVNRKEPLRLLVNAAFAPDYGAIRRRSTACNWAVCWISIPTT